MRKQRTKLTPGRGTLLSLLGPGAIQRVSELIGMRYLTAREILRGIRDPKVSQLEAIAGVIGISVTECLERWLAAREHYRLEAATAAKHIPIHTHGDGTGPCHCGGVAVPDLSPAAVEQRAEMGIGLSEHVEPDAPPRFRGRAQ